VSQNA